MSESTLTFRDSNSFDSRNAINGLHTVMDGLELQFVGVDDDLKSGFSVHAQGNMPSADDVRKVLKSDVSLSHLKPKISGNTIEFVHE